MEQKCLSEIITFTLGKNSSRLNIPPSEIYTQDDFERDLHSSSNVSKDTDCVINLIRTRASLLSDETRNKCITSNFIQCSFDRQVLDPWYFCYQFNEGKDIEQQISMFHQGITLSVKKLNIKIIGELKIPLVNIAKQQMIGNMYKQSIIQNDLMQKQAENMRILTMETIKRITEGE